MPFELHSPAFDDGDPIPREYGYTARNVNPPLEWTGVPDGTDTVALVMDDPDAVEPADKIWDHWVVWNLPAERGGVPEDASLAQASEGPNDYGERGYGGPNPPDGEHTYRFEAYAVDGDLDLRDADADALRAAVEGRTLATATIEGTYAP
ncbi:YbhB/YbcL family Raf kinase inhibitor-like protein [Halococcoides cellulosivorans]|uniref:YbhB/YbcL family Raf kinase inhibitor-like protein n=1 Tax=Halococcoides cellulosivorans TaxID=1679096 RepID=UPI001F480A76|nr:YbhB/YbcL family Raf kinase inhibitor-like protein [Halococcoides cellulosivorans]